ncbi:hypothetical protein [Actinoplanes subtropicus]|uniref:hypothetical protein n=1 Tax=Actinoplanes subtropicus TaxID=543632 RepID=UPI0012F7BAB5|nr:hypothetical protein [Actinoplanes subtropicus]
MADTPPCCASADEPCPQHRQAQRATRFEGPSKRGGRGTRVVGESGKAKPAGTQENQQ